jgi:hypothetical protein
MDSDSDNEKYSTSEDTEDEPRPPSRRSSTSQPATPDFSDSSSEDEGNVGNVAGQQPQPCLWTLPPQPRRRVVHTFTGAPNGKSREAAYVMSESTPLSILLLFFAEITLLIVYVLLGISPPGKYPKEHIQYSNHGESLKSTILLCWLWRRIATIVSS